MYDIVFDLEATCWSTNPPRQMETIEIGAVKINDKGKTVGSFTVFIKPFLFTELSKFCKSLTHITQEQVDNGITFPEAIKQFHTWCGDEFRLWSWGDYDKKQLKQDGMLHGVDVSFLNGRHYNLSMGFRRKEKTKKCGVSTALALSNLTFEGTQHRGIDDAINIAKIFCLNREWYIENCQHTGGVLDT